MLPSMLWAPTHVQASKAGKDGLLPKIIYECDITFADSCSIG
jgi:hypothetical protein